MQQTKDTTLSDLRAFVASKKAKFETLPLFDYLQNASVDALLRVGFTPALSHFVMSFGRDLNPVIFRYPDEKMAQRGSTESEERRHRLMIIINNHTREDETHWPLFLEDFQKLGFGKAMGWDSYTFTETLRFLWSDETKRGRMLTYELCKLCADPDQDPCLRFAIIESMEQIGNVFFHHTCHFIAPTLEDAISESLSYYGSFHFAQETGHTITANAEDEMFINSYPLNQHTFEQGCLLVQNVFQMFETWMHELICFALKREEEIENDNNCPTLSRH